MKRPFVLVTVALLVAGLILFGLTDAAISVADTDTPSNEVTSGTSNHSASATITITMYAVADE